MTGRTFSARIDKVPIHPDMILHNLIATTRSFLRVTEAVRYLLIFGLGAAGSIGNGYLLYGVLGFKAGRRYGIAVAPAFPVGMGVSFAPLERELYEELRSFFLVSIGGLLLTLALSSLFRNILFRGQSFDYPLKRSPKPCRG